MFARFIQLAKVHLGVVWLIRTRCQVNFGGGLCLDCYTGSRISRRGGVDLVGGAWTPEAATFRKFCMSK